MKNHNLQRTLATKLLSPLLAPILALSHADAAPSSTNETSPWDRDDGQWISISGKIVSSSEGRFILDYGPGAILIEFDGYLPTSERMIFPTNTGVAITGRIDADKGAQRSIEASSVFVKSSQKSYFANPDDEEEVLARLTNPIRQPHSIVSGRVIMTAPDFMTIDTGNMLIDVSTLAMTRIQGQQFTYSKGDRLEITGAMLDGFSTGTQLMAVNISRK